MRTAGGVLHFCRVLGRAVEVDAAVFVRRRKAGLSLKVEVVLATDAEAAAEGMDSRLERRLRVAPAEFTRIEHELLGRHGIVDVEDGRQNLPLDVGEPRRCPRCGEGRCRHRKHRLAAVERRRLDEDRIVTHDRAAVVAAGNVARRHHRDHARCASHSGEIERCQICVCVWALRDVDLQCARRFGQVIDVACGPTDVQVSAVVGNGLGDRVAHGAVLEAGQRSTALPVATSRANFRNRLPATVCR